MLVLEQNAPQTYYTQNRMITGEDYNIAPTSSQEIIKVKSSNRIASGISRYFDLKDVTGKYSSTNHMVPDGVFIEKAILLKIVLHLVTQTDIEGQLKTQIIPIIQSRAISNFYFSNYAKIIVSDLNAVWVQSTKSTNKSTGFITKCSNSISSWSVYRRFIKIC